MADRIGKRNYEFEYKFLGSEADRWHKKAKWHTDRAGTDMPAKFEKAAPMKFKAELLDDEHPMRMGPGGRWAFRG